MDDIIVIGIGATLVLDAWTLARKPLLRIAAPNYGLLGRWIGHMRHGQFHHDSILAAAPVRGEKLLGWVAHYLIGIVFALILVGAFGEAWVESPTLGPALIVGVGTTVAPFLLMQPAIGAGLASSRTPNPSAARVQTLVTHTVFGLGLFAAAWAAHFVDRL